MKIIKLDRRYTQCKFNNYWVALHFYEPYDGNPYRSYIVKCKLQELYGPTKFAMYNNPHPWYNEYPSNSVEIIYLRDPSVLTFLQLSGALDESN